MKQQKNFGLSQQTLKKESYDHFKLGKNWDLGFISKEGIENRRDAKKAETERKRMQTQVMAQLASEPTGQNQGGISTGAAVAIGLVVVVGVFLVLGKMNKNRKAKQAAAEQANPAAVANKIA